MPMSTASLLSVQDARGVDTNFESSTSGSWTWRTGGFGDDGDDGGLPGRTRASPRRAKEGRKQLSGRERGRGDEGGEGEADEGELVGGELVADDAGPTEEGGERGGDNEAE